MFQHANATWLNSIGKALKSADEATGAAKAGAKVTSAATHEMPEASRAINAPGLSNADPLASALRRDPLATAQLGRCITKQQQDMNRDSATRHCYSQYQQCVQRQNPLPSLDRPFEACINETNR
jgi:hypothetical protein